MPKSNLIEPRQLTRARDEMLIQMASALVMLGTGHGKSYLPLAEATLVMCRELSRPDQDLTKPSDPG